MDEMAKDQWMPGEASQKNTLRCYSSLMITTGNFIIRKACLIKKYTKN